MSNDINRGEDSAQDLVSKAAANVSSSVQAAKDSTAEVLADAGEKVSRAAESARYASGRIASSNSPQSLLATLRSLVASNPLGAAIGALGAGFLVGLAFPVSSIEREKVGPLGETLTDSAKATANELVAHGKTAVADAVAEALGAPRQPNA